VPLDNLLSRASIANLIESNRHIMANKPHAQIIAESHLIGVDLLITDAKTALTLLDLAESSETAELKSRRIEEARDAHETILSFLRRLNPTAEQSAILSAKLHTLKARLTAADRLVG
jgi:hypothetical protein